MITIPTNGMLTERVVEKVARMCRECPTSSIGINLSLDGVEDEHDDIRGVEGNWTLAMETWRRLKELQQEHKNPVVTVSLNHTCAAEQGGGERSGLKAVGLLPHR
mgnify:CR=1 FL=1